MIDYDNLKTFEVLEILTGLQKAKHIRITNYDSVPLEVTLRGELRNVKVEIQSSFIEEYRKLFKGKKMGSMGTLGSVKKNMEKFMKEYPKYSKETILKATEAYIKDCSKNGYQYLQQADYFIFKAQDYTRTNFTSRLLQWCEEIEENGFQEDKERVEGI